MKEMRMGRCGERFKGSTGDWPHKCRRAAGHKGPHRTTIFEWTGDSYPKFRTDIKPGSFANEVARDTIASIRQVLGAFGQDPEEVLQRLGAPALEKAQEDDSLRYDALDE